MEGRALPPRVSLVLPTCAVKWRAVDYTLVQHVSYECHALHQSDASKMSAYDLSGHSN